MICAEKRYNLPTPWRAEGLQVIIKLWRRIFLDVTASMASPPIAGLGEYPVPGALFTMQLSKKTPPPAARTTSSILKHIGVIVAMPK